MSFPAETVVPNEWRHNAGRFRQFSMRHFLAFVLAVGIVIPAGLHHLQRLKQKQSLLQYQKFAFAGFPSSDEHSEIQKKLQPTGLLGTIGYSLGRTVVGEQRIDFVRPARGSQDYQVVAFETGKFLKNDVLVIRLALGDGCGGSIDLFDGDVDLAVAPVDQEAARSKSLARLYNIRPNQTGLLVVKVKRNRKYQLGLSGNWDPTLGKANNALVSIHAMNTGRGE